MRWTRRDSYRDRSHRGQCSKAIHKVGTSPGGGGGGSGSDGVVTMFDVHLRIEIEQCGLWGHPSGTGAVRARPGPWQMDWRHVPAKRVWTTISRPFGVGSANV